MDQRYQHVVLGIVYQTKKGATNSAENVRQRLKALDILGALQAKVQTLDIDMSGAKHVTDTMAKYTAEFRTVVQEEQEQEQVQEPEQEEQHEEHFK